MNAPAEYDIESIRRKWIGKIVARETGRYPVEYEAIRRFCHMTGDQNPLFLDATHGKRGPYGAVIAPPSTVLLFDGHGPWPPSQQQADRQGPWFAFGIPVLGDRGINMGVEWEYYEPMRVGDWLRHELSVIDVFVKSIRLDPLAVWIVTERLTTNQNGTAVARCRNTLIVHRPPLD